MNRSHIILVTHTDKLLRRTLLGVACQSTRPDTVVVSCDGDDPKIHSTMQAACDEFDLSLELILRPSSDLARPGQVRNNAVRHLLKLGAATSDALIFFDGDCIPEPGAVRKHLDALKRGQLVLGGRFDLSPEQGEAFDESALRRGELPFEPTQEQLGALTLRRKRLLRQAKMRRFGFARLGIPKPHKPKLITANCSTTVGVFTEINGIDESFEQWGQEDDDFARRVYQMRGRPVVEVGSIHSYHQHHISRAPERWNLSPNAPRLEQPAPTRCVHGLESPIDQHEPIAETLTPKPTMAISR